MGFDALAVKFRSVHPFNRARKEGKCKKGEPSKSLHGKVCIIRISVVDCFGLLPGIPTAGYGTCNRAIAQTCRRRLAVGRDEDNLQHPVA